MRNPVLAPAPSALIALSASPGAVRVPDAGKKVFRKCSACHQAGEKAKSRVGPALNCVVGAPAGSVEGFRYSDALTDSGIVWAEESLAGYLADPKGFLPGNKKTFAGLRKAGNITNVVAYLAGFSADRSEATNDAAGKDRRLCCRSSRTPAGRSRPELPLSPR